MSDSRMRRVKLGATIDRTDTKRPLGRLLVDRGLIKTSDVLATLGHQRFSDAQLGHLLCAHGLLSEVDLFRTLALQYDVPFITPDEIPPDPSLLASIEPHIALQVHAMPWARVDGVTLVATSAPETYEQALATLPAHLLPASMIIVSRKTIEQTICAHSTSALSQRAEHLVPDDLSCRNLPAQIKTLLALLFCALTFGLFMQWFTLGGLYRAVFLFAIAMVCVGIAIKTSGALLQLFSKVPILASTAKLPEKLPRVSLLIPLHDESDILNTLLKRIDLLTYPKALLDVILVVEADDVRTRDHLAQADLPFWMRMLIVPKGQIMTKPRAMNYALPFCQGDIIGIYDAEDAPHPEQISDVVAAFNSQPANVACVQAVLDFYNAKANALSRFFAIEYATWFRLILPGVARLGFAIPLGGTSVFFRRAALEKLHGWDAHNVTEDADLGIRLARAGFRTILIDSVTLEEANNQPWPWIKQRSRWLKGYLITYFTHMRRPIRLLFELGVWKFIGFQGFFLSAISQYMLAPMIWSCMLIYLGAPQWIEGVLPRDLLASLMVTFLVMWCISTSVYITAVAGEKHRHLIPWTLCMSVYLALGTLAIYKGAWELVTRPFYWEKTAHGHSEGALDQDGSAEPASSLSRVTKATEI
ncbi:MAG: glycosyltransferase [Planktotalea sp.]|uniref:glycosyltransferase n=1 Tax=Planktotalea sp. TaxID=2029877 RepID=UPI003C785858